MFHGEILADSSNVIMVHEAGYPPVAYIPSSDVCADFLSETSRETHCPFKGYASYWSIKVGDETAENAAWAYPRSYEEVTELADCIAFDKRFVDEDIVSEH